MSITVRDEHGVELYTVNIADMPSKLTIDPKVDIPCQLNCFLNHKEGLAERRRQRKRVEYERLKEHKIHCDTCNVDIHPRLWDKHVGTIKRQSGGLARPRDPETYYCDVCDQTMKFMSRITHDASKKHSKNLDKLRQQPCIDDDGAYCRALKARDDARNRSTNELDQ